MGYGLSKGKRQMTELERDLGRRWFDEVWNKGRREAIAEMLTPESIIHEGGVDTVGIEGFYPYFDRFRSAFSNIRVDVEDTIAQDDKVCVRWSFTGKHTGDGLGIAASGITLHLTGISILRVANNKLMEGWQNWDMLAMTEQIKGMHRSPTYISADIKMPAASAAG
jgi:predicted ester cyclase